MADELRGKVSIVDVIGQFVELRRAGAEFAGKCPFHKDDTPSFSVNEEKGVFVCHGCGAGGDVFNFVMRLEGLDFPAAKRRVAELAGLNPADFDRPQQRGGSKVIPMDAGGLSEKPKNTAYYGYTDEREKSLYEIVRREWLEYVDGAPVKKKTFQQRYKDPERPGEYIWKKHPRQVLYRLHLVVKADTVWLVEGEKDVHTLQGLGLVATTKPGGSNARWLKGYSEALAGRKVFIVPDNDDAGIKCAQQAYDAIAQTSIAIVVRVPGPPKSDVSDWIQAGGTIEQLLELARLAEDAAAQEKRTKIVGAKRDPNEIAREIMADHSFIADEAGLLYEYNGRFWEKTVKERLKRYALQYDSEHHTNQRRRNEVADFIVTSVQTPRIPWRQLALTEVPVLNGVFNVQTLELRPHRREDYLETVVPVAYEAQTDCPTWRKCLVDYFGSDADAERKILALQQFFGYVLLPHAKFKKALILFGESDCGKTEPLKLLESIVGADNVCSVGVEQMDDSRARVPLVGKMLNKLSELSDDAVIADGGFKTLISTEESILVDPKFVSPYMYTPFAKHVIVTNKLPRINDLTYGTYGRLLIIKFNHVIPKERQDRTLTERLAAELPGVLNWALGGALDLIESGGRWVEIAESVEIINEYRQDENEINAFLEEKCTKVEGAYITAADVRSRFRTWAGRNYSHRAIGVMMKSAGYKSKPVDSERRHYGLRWNDLL